MVKTIHKTNKAPDPVGPYSQAVEINGTIFCSGQIPLDPATGVILTGDIKDQTQLVMKNIGAVLEAAGLGFENIVKSGIFLTDLGDFSQVNEVYAGYFQNEPPARSCVQVAALPKAVNVEIEVIACR